MDDFRAFADEGGGVLSITHDIELVLRVADRIAVFKDGTVVEETAVANFASPELLRHPFSRALWAALPEHGLFDAAFEMGGGSQARSGRCLRRAISEFSYDGRPIVARIRHARSSRASAWRFPRRRAAAKPRSVSILSGYLEPARGSVTLGRRAALPTPRHGPVQMIWQHPERMLDPLLTMEKSLAECPCDAETLAELRDMIGVRDAWLTRRPRELSGGELQRFCIVRALACAPRYLICDEISTMLDAVTQADLWARLLRWADDTRRGHGRGVPLAASDATASRRASSSCSASQARGRTIRSIAGFVRHACALGFFAAMVLAKDASTR